MRKGAAPGGSRYRKLATPLPADGIKDDPSTRFVCDIVYPGNYILFVRDDDMLGSSRQQFAPLVALARRGDGNRTFEFNSVNSSQAHTTGSRCDQNKLTLFQAPDLN